MWCFNLLKNVRLRNSIKYMYECNIKYSTKYYKINENAFGLNDQEKEVS